MTTKSAKNRVVTMSDRDRPVVRRTERSSSGKVMNHWMYLTYWNNMISHIIVCNLEYYIPKSDESLHYHGTR